VAETLRRLINRSRLSFLGFALEYKVSSTLDLVFRQTVA